MAVPMNMLNRVYMPNVSRAGRISQKIYNDQPIKIKDKRTRKTIMAIITFNYNSKTKQNKKHFYITIFVLSS